MNLGQLIDPEWVQQGRPDRFPRPRPARPAAPGAVRTVTSDKLETEQAPAREIVDAEGRSPEPETLLARPPQKRPAAAPRAPVVATTGRPAVGFTKAILVLLAGYPPEFEGLASGETRELLGENAPEGKTVVSAILSQLVAAGDLEKSGEERSYKFKITPQGRARVA